MATEPTIIEKAESIVASVAGLPVSTQIHLLVRRVAEKRRCTSTLIERSLNIDDGHPDEAVRVLALEIAKYTTAW